MSSPTTGAAWAADVRLAVCAVAQQGVFTRMQASASGFSAAQIDRRVRTGVWIRMLPRVYRHAATPVTGSLPCWAAVAWAGPDCALSHVTAAAIWRLQPHTTPRPTIGAPVELLVPVSRSPRAAGVVVHRVATIHPDDVIRLAGLPVTDPARTIIDLAGVLDELDLRAAVERARARRLVTIRAVLLRLEEIGGGGRPGIARLRALLVAVGSGPVEPSARMTG